MITLRKADPLVLTGGQALLPRVNLLPPEIGERRAFRRVQVGLGSSVVAAVGVVVVLLVSASGSVADAQSDVDTAAARQRVLQSQTAQLRDVTATYRRTAAAQAMLTAAMGSEIRYSRFLDDLSRLVPTNVWVKSVTFTETAPAAAGAAAPATAVVAGRGTVTFSGVAFTHQDVSAWLDALAGQKGLTAVTLSSSTEALLGSRPTVNWTTTAVVSDDALSGRYTLQGS